MTLGETRRYDGERASSKGERAVVLGASMAGLLAARVLDDAYERVTVVERDSLPTAPETRDGVPQGKHVHVLLEAGRSSISDLFPGYGEDLVDAGALIIDVGQELRHYDEGGYLAPPARRMEMYCASRPLLETVVRRHLAELDGVTIRDNTQFVAYRTDADADRIDGVRVRGDDGLETLEAAVVVDATGRASRTPAWLAENGYGEPPVEEVEIDMVYSTLRVNRPEGDRRMPFVPQSAPRTRGGAAFPVEGGEWVVTLGGMHETDPPATVEGFLPYARELPVEDIETILASHEVVSDGVERYPFPSNRRVRYESLDRFPGGLVVLGDAIASFNPIYGQGMSVAALEALALHETLASSGDGPLGKRFAERATDVVDIAWQMAVGSDAAFEATDGPTPPGASMFDTYLSRLVRQAHTDPRLSEAFYRVVGMEVAPTDLLRPGTVWRTVTP
ncbi:FAD-dependent oxidoreductase [Halorubrum sodomense]|uniref:2-polyprenyl-6-methoxyphenol hydroxylase n=1 Tax=Halorubrum sodomense TaxID=35743 RepID=A0A1I6GVK0_HALSD|nr:FAD-dependent monooxygenase [Halorubrum sodomense]SFR46218.1 2-polyprenyl-6-methoxyphenol hydroxylase [Halorubrum sodomense]